MAYMPYVKNIVVLSFMAIMFLQMAGCGRTGSSSGRDGAPSYHVDASKIPDAVPKHEKRSRYGNPASYVIKGQRHYVMREAKNYREVGEASWYGTKFHRRRTSSGEPYDLAGMTAAHRTLPLPSYVRVRNLQNNKTVIVKVNDRGPFAKNRIIDLSYVAAKKLGINGTSRVEVSVINPSTHQPTNSQLASSGIISPPDKDGNQKVYLQMGVFSEKSNAEKIARSIEDHIQAPVQIKSDQHNNKLIYRVRVPVNASKADMMYDKLARLGKPMKILE